MKKRDKIVVQLDLTQREVDALYIVSHCIAGTPKSMRTVFSWMGDDNKGFLEILEPYTSKQIFGYNVDEWVSGQISFNDD
jgi:hypothetical protein